MGLPGFISVKITTVFDQEKKLVSRNLQYLGGVGLNSLSACTLGKSNHWKVNRSIMSDTIDLDDGTYKLGKKHVGPGNFDYKWHPIEVGEDGEEYDEEESDD